MTATTFLAAIFLNASPAPVSVPAPASATREPLYCQDCAPAPRMGEKAAWLLGGLALVSFFIGRKQVVA